MLNIGLRPNHFNFHKCKQNKYVINDVIAYSNILTATDQKCKNKGQHVEFISQSIKLLKTLIFFLHLAVRWYDRSEMWLKTKVSD